MSVKMAFLIFYGLNNHSGLTQWSILPSEHLSDVIIILCNPFVKRALPNFSSRTPYSCYDRLQLKNNNSRQTTHVSLLKSLSNAKQITQEKIGILLVYVISLFMRKIVMSICRAIGIIIGKHI